MGLGPVGTSEDAQRMSCRGRCSRWCLYGVVVRNGPSDQPPRDGVGDSGDPVRRQVPGDGAVDVWSISADETTLRSVLGLIVEEWWADCWFCVLIEGAAWELGAKKPPAVSYDDGYLTVDLGSSHFHVCIGEHRGAPKALADRRRTQRAELFRRLHDGCPVSWGLRLFNGADEQQLTVLLPNPLLSRSSELESPPRWDRLQAWDYLRKQLLGLAVDPADRTAIEFAYDPFATPSSGDPVS